MKKKLLFVITQLYRGGAETSLVNLLKNLDDTKYDVDFLISEQTPEKDAVSLIPSIPSWVHICNVYKCGKKRKLFNLMCGKLLYTYQERQQYSVSALNFVRNKEYDWAFFVGEWRSPDFVTNEVNAKQKAVWIHADLSKAEYFDANSYFSSFDSFDYYIFVSKNSLESSCKKYPFIREKATVIYNISDVELIKEKSKEQVNDFQVDTKPIFVTAANFREAKNHIRQVEAMKILKDKGIDFYWVNIGSTADENLVHKVKQLVKKYALEKNFLILGPKENPYQYIANADAVTVLSNYESWSMVITEAKILDIPVIATRTSGALEQIEDEKTGMLTNFTVQNIAEKIEKFLTTPALQKSIKENIENFDNTKEILDSFNLLVNSNKIIAKQSQNKILYVIDDINYIGGAHIATVLQIVELLKRGADVTIFSNSIPKPGLRTDLNGAKFISWKDFKEDRIFNSRLLFCLTNKFMTKKQKTFKLKLTYHGKILKDKNSFETMVLPKLSDLLSNYDTVCVMSEASSFKTVVALSTSNNKIQWIHTDYCEWRNKTDWTQKITKNDGEIWNKYNNIMVLSENIKESFCKLYPNLQDKVVVIKNLMPCEQIIEKSMANQIPANVVKFITVGRFGTEKAYDRLIQVLARLKKDGYTFHWTIVGDGPEMDSIQEMLIDESLEKCVFLAGSQKNPFTYVRESDVFALLSDYEGLPNTIYESLILGVPVLATNVGGISTQVKDSENGWLVENDEVSIYKGIKNLLDDPEEIKRVKKNIENYKYNNDEIKEKAEKIFYLN